MVIHARVPNLYSNVQFIMRYRHQSRMVGEAAYHFTNLNSVVCFLENCSAGDFSIDPEAYYASMAGGSLKPLHPSSPDQSSVPNHHPSLDNGSNVMDGSDSSVRTSTHNNAGSGSEGGGERVLERVVAAVVQPHTFINCSVEDLRVGDVELLLQECLQLQAAIYSVFYLVPSAWPDIYRT